MFLGRNFVNLFNSIYDNEYYVSLFEFVMNNHGMTPTGIMTQNYTGGQIIDVCNDFWMALPDSPEIRRDPFFLLCDIAELSLEDCDNDYEGEW